jgi:hypothetical protein
VTAYIDINQFVIRSRPRCPKKIEKYPRLELIVLIASFNNDIFSGENKSDFYDKTEILLLNTHNPNITLFVLKII